MNNNMQANSNTKLLDSMPEKVRNTVVLFIAAGWCFKEGANFIEKASAFVKDEFPKVEESFNKLINKFKGGNNTFDALDCCEDNTVNEVPAS